MENTSVHESMTTLIQSALQRIEEEERAAIVVAVETGSRAWGFASLDSDYDVRFIYVRRPEFYLSVDLEERSDVIERPLENELDLRGWDIRKALRLFRKSNPPMIEWLQSPFIYQERFSFAAQLRAMLPRFYSPKACLHYYLHMAQGNFREYLRGDTVWRKKYFYVLRPVLAMLWIEKGLGPVPIEFSKLVEATIGDPVMKRAVDDLVAAKCAGAELDRGPRIPAISNFIEREMARLEVVTGERKRAAPPLEILNELFRFTLREVWAQNET